MSDFTVPKQSWKLIRAILPKRLQPFARGFKKRLQRVAAGEHLAEPYRTVYPYTQASWSRQQNLVALGRRIDAEGIPGAIVECGVLDGGTAALMAWATKDRAVHLFDSWEGLPEPTEEDGHDADMWAGECVGNPGRVLSVMAKLRVNKDRLHFYRGWFDDTFLTVDISPVALVHVDPDYYEPVKLCLEKWWPVLSPGGFMQFDDYQAFIGCKLAVDEFLAANPDLRLETFGVGSPAYFIRKP